MNVYHQEIEKWHIKSSDEPGMHHVIKPLEQDCQTVNIFRLNLEAGSSYALASGIFEMNPVLIKGKAVISGVALEASLDKFDSFYIPGKSDVQITAKEDAVFYIGAANCDGVGKPFVRKYDSELPLGEIHQFHGEGSGKREVFFTLNPEVPASRLICGLTWGADGNWTSWPPHQHENDLEEVYCYFDMEAPKYGLHISYLNGQSIDDAVIHIVQSSSMVLAPKGYHPTVATPDTQNTYLWVLASFSSEQRRYDLAKTDPKFV
ncbi:MAG: 5-deoxy-glucuronate isomerase [Eubacterium sp.]